MRYSVLARYSFFASVTILSGLLGCTGGEKQQTLDSKKVEKVDLVQRVTMQATAESISQQVVIAPYDGNIKKIFVRNGDLVKAGAPLVNVESSNSLGTAFPLRANFSGTITYIGVRPGEYVKGKNEDKVLVRVDDLSQMLIRAKVSEADYPKIKVGQETEIAVQALPGLILKGEIAEVSMAPSENKRWRGNESIQYEIIIRLKDFPEALKPGMSVVVDAITAKKTGVLALPHEYIRRKDKKFYVELESSGDLKEVQIGLQTDHYVEVIGLEEGAEVNPVDFYKKQDSK